MKICLITPGILPVPSNNGGAIEKIIYETANFIGRKHEVLVLHVGSEKYKNRVHFKHIKKRFSGFFAELIFGFLCLFHTNHHITHLHTPLTALPFVLFKKVRHTKLIYTCHNPAWTVDKRELDVGNKIILLLEHFIMKHVDKVVAISDRMKKNMIKYHINACYIPNFVNTYKFKPTGVRWKKIQGKMVLYVGKMTKTKGISYLLNAIPKVKSKINDVNFVFVGPGSFEQNTYPNFSKKSAIFLGPVSEDDLPKIYRIADVFCLPSLREGMPLVVLEALASGVPVVMTDVSGSDELINNNNGIIIQRKNSDAIADAIINILNKKTNKIKISETVEKYKKENVLRMYEKLYGELI